MKSSIGATAPVGQMNQHSTFRPGERRRVTKNVLAMLTTNVVHKATMFVIYILVARYLGAHQFGQLSLAVVLLYSWHKISLVGMQTLLTREVAVNRDLAASYFLHASVICLVTSTVGMAVLVPFVKVMDYSPDTRTVIYVMFVGLVPMVLTQISEGIFQGLERMHLIGYVNIPFCALKIAAVFVSIKLGYGIRGIAISLAVMQFAVMIVEWRVLSKMMGPPGLAFERQTAVRMLRASSSFLGIQATNAISAALAVAILSSFCDEEAVGVFSAANQLLVPFSLVFTNVALAMFPVMCRGYGASESELVAVVRRMIEGLLIIATPAVLGLFVLADTIVVLIYDDAQFLASAQVLRISVWSLFAQVLSSVIGQALWASARERLSLRITVINAFVQCLSCILLVVSFGVIGAALSVLLTSVINLIQHLIPATKLFPGVRLASALSKPVVASIAMTAFIVYAEDLPLLATIAISVALYGCVLLGLFVFSAGGLSQFRAACADLWAA